VFDFLLRASMPVIFSTIAALLIWAIFSLIPALLFVIAVLLFLMARLATL
jgi:hypothetical protein